MIPNQARTDVAAYIRPTALEIATAAVTGLAPVTPLPPPGPTPRTALEDAIRPALADAPCFVTFSGGRDSSAVLAVAVALARREGHELPIPATKIYPDHPESEESAWQRLVIDHLGLTEWMRVEYGDEIELLGPIARASLRDRGLLWPPALQVHSDWYQRLAPGSVLTGEGGDDVLGARRISALRKLRQRRLPSRKLVVMTASSLLPLSVRIRQHQRALSPWMPEWLTEKAARYASEQLARELADTPLRYDESTWHIRRHRSWATYQHNHELIGRDSGVTIHEPLLDEVFLAALAHLGGAMGFSGRTATMRALFSDLLPLTLIARQTKAGFDGPYTGFSMRDFARSWDGTGVDADLVNADALRKAWLTKPTMTGSLLLQQVWMQQKGIPLAGARQQ